MNLVEEMRKNAGVEINEGKKIKRALAITALLSSLGVSAMNNNKDWKDGLNTQEIQYVQDNKKYFEHMKGEMLKSGVGGEKLRKDLKKSVGLKMKRDGIN